MLELKIKAGRRSIPIFELPAALGRRQAYQEIGDQVDALIAFLDDLQGDVDLEDSEASMSNIDACGRLLPGNYVGSQDEDREPDDDAQATSPGRNGTRSALPTGAPVTIAARPSRPSGTRRRRMTRIATRPRMMIRPGAMSLIWNGTKTPKRFTRSMLPIRPWGRSTPLSRISGLTSCASSHCI